MTSCRVKPYQLIDRKSDKDDSKENDDNQVILEDGLQDVKELKKVDQEDIEDDGTDDNLEDEKKDIIAAKYIKVIYSVSFSDLAIYTIELPVKEHGRPEVKVAKVSEVKIFKIMMSSRRLMMKDKKPSVVAR